jgi:hypothetical protein
MNQNNQKVYLRFVVHNKDSDSHRLQGLFHAVYELSDSKKLTYEEEAQFRALTIWFKENLKIPTRFARSKNPKPHNKAISWFKDSAKEHIRKMREMSEILKKHGITTKMIHEKKIGYVVYEDEFQVTAVPFSETEA